MTCQFCGQVSGRLNGVQLSSPGRRLGAYLLDVVLMVVTAVIGWLVWSLNCLEERPVAGQATARDEGPQAQDGAQRDLGSNVPGRGRGEVRRLGRKHLHPWYPDLHAALGSEDVRPCRLLRLSLPALLSAMVVAACGGSTASPPTTATPPTTPTTSPTTSPPLSEPPTTSAPAVSLGAGPGGRCPSPAALNAAFATSARFVDGGVMTPGGGPPGATEELMCNYASGLPTGHIALADDEPPGTSDVRLVLGLIGHDRSLAPPLRSIDIAGCPLWAGPGVRI